MNIPSVSTAHPVPSVQVRPALVTDAAAIADIYNESIAVGTLTMDRDPWTTEKVQTKLATATAREAWQVIGTPTQVAGWGVIKKYSDRWGYRVCCESSIYLSQTQIGKGYGRMLQTALIDEARALGYHHIVAKILGCNEGSIAFHERFGFEVVGRQKEVGYLNGCWHDVVILQLILPDVTPNMIPLL